MTDLNEAHTGDENLAKCSAQSNLIANRSTKFVQSHLYSQAMEVLFPTDESTVYTLVEHNSKGSRKAKHSRRVKSPKIKENWLGLGNEVC